MNTRLVALVLLILSVSACSAGGQQQRANKVILFIGDAGGIPTMNAASIYGYNEPRKLFIQNMPSIALMETSAASQWVTDSAAGMTAIVTGHKTHNGVISQSDTAVRRRKDGAPLKTILEYAEERGFATGVVSNSSVASATPAACYAHVNDRNKDGEIFSQILKPAFGDGIDVVVGPGREEIIEETQKIGLDVLGALRERGYEVYDSLDSISASTKRLVALFDNSDFDLGRAAHRAIDALSQNPNGFFLMVEADLHTEDLLRGLDRAVAFDRVIRSVAERMNPDETLILFTADHSYDLRIHDGDRDRPLISEREKAALPEGDAPLRLENVRRDDDHTAEEVLLAAQGPGAERVKGIVSNTDVFHIMMFAYGWSADSATASAIRGLAGTEANAER